jgi:hypothetical protein
MYSQYIMARVVRFHEYMDTAAAAAAHRRDKYDEAGALEEKAAALRRAIFIFDQWQACP